MVSVVLPTYNGSRFLRQSVESVRAQTFQDWELIIVDDCSTDSTPDIIAEVVSSDPRIRSVRHETKRKLTAALNTGFALARREYLTWTSDDNLYRPLALATMVEYLDTHPLVSLVYAGFSKIDDSGRIIGTETARPPEVLVESNAVGPCFLYRRTLHEQAGPYAEDLFLAEDWEFWLRVFLRWQCVALPDDLYFYRWHDAMLTATRQHEVSLIVERAIMRHLPEIRSRSRILACRSRLSLARRARRRGSVAGWLRHFSAAFALSPVLALRDPRGIRELLMAAPGWIARRVRRTLSLGKVM